MLYSVCLLAMLGQGRELMAQTEATGDSLARQRKYENAFDYLLQKPLKNETFSNKKLGDHLFLMGGVGLNWLNVDGASPSPQASLMMGDWLTPVHGVRVGAKAGWMHYGAGKNKYIGAELDYLLNLTALQQAGYSLQRPFELSALLGIEAVYARKSGVSRWGSGVHTGLLGTLRLSNLTSVFLEPRVTFYSNGVTPLGEPSWRNYKLAGSVNVGLSYRLLSGDARGKDKYSQQSGDDNMFLSVGVGTGAVVRRPLRTTFENLGLTGSVAIGKEVNAYSAFRGKLRLGYYPVSESPKLKEAAVQVDYLFNLTNLMGGYHDGRKFWLNGVAGVELAASKWVNTELSPGIGAGVQMNFRIGRQSSFYVEPRVALYGGDFEPVRNSFRKFDLLSTLEAGFTFYRREKTDGRVGNGLFENKSFWDNLFVQGALGLSSAATSEVFRHPSDYAEPMVYVGIGKWLSACSGLRLAAEVRKYKSYPADNRKNLASAGIDYLFNFTNFMGGYDPERRFELIGVAGARLGAKSEQRHLYPGVNVGVQGLYHLNVMAGIFVEPSLQAYSSDLVDAGIHVGGMGFLGNVAVGINLRMRGYDVRQNRALYKKDADARHRFVYAALGPSVQIRNLHQFYFDARAGYGQWYDAFAAWRVGVNWTNRKHFSRWSADLDWLLDLSTLAYGYDNDRIVGVHAFSGVGLGYLDERQRTSFSPDLHVGGQLRVRLSPKLDLFAEPCLTGRFITVKTAGKHVAPHFSTQFGISYNLTQIGH